jgi:predicted small metal-binding protein
MLSLSCLDTGARVIETDSECNYVARGMTEEELWKDATEHIVKAHGMKIEDITPQFKNYNKRYIKHS